MNKPIQKPVKLNQKKQKGTKGGTPALRQHSIPVGRRS